MAMKVYIVSNNARPLVDSAYIEMFLDRGWVIVDKPSRADLIQFTGGADVSPALYEHVKHISTKSDIVRDKYEMYVYMKMRNKVPMAGICRGAQFLWVMNGGGLYQDVTGHKVDHDIYDKAGNFICSATSTHHQMMMSRAWKLEFPEEKVYPVLAIGKQKGEKLAYDKVSGSFAFDSGDSGDIEVACIRGTKSLCFQPHPERGEKELTDFYFSLIWQYLLDKG